MLFARLVAWLASELLPNMRSMKTGSLSIVRSMTVLELAVGWSCLLGMVRSRILVKSEWEFTAIVNSQSGTACYHLS